MLNANEIEGLLHYLEYLMMSMIADPLSKHIEDPEVLGFMYDRVYAVINQLEEDIHDYKINMAVEKSNKQQ